MTFGETLKKYRLMNNLSQEELASKLDIARSNISKYEKGDLEPTISIILKLAEIFKVDANTLLGTRSVDYIDPCEAFIYDHMLNKPSVILYWRKYINQFSQKIEEHLEDSPVNIKAISCITCEWFLNLIDASSKDVKLCNTINSIFENIAIILDEYAVHKNDNVFEDLLKNIQTFNKTYFNL